MYKVIASVLVAAPLCASTLALSAPGRSATITPHVSTNDLAVSDRESFAFVQEELLNSLMDDESVGGAMKDALKDALSSLLSSIADSAQDTCDQIAKSLEKTLDKTPDQVTKSMEDLLDGIDFAETSSKRVADHKALVSMLQERGIWSSMKKKAKNAWSSIKGHAGDFMRKLASKMKPLIFKVMTDVLPSVKDKAASLLTKACSAADEKLRSFEDSSSSESDD